MLVGHGHYDHMSDAASVGARTGATVVGAPVTTEKLATHTIDAKQVRTVTGRGGEVLQLGAFKVEPILGEHGDPPAALVGAFDAALKATTTPPTPEQVAEQATIRQRGTQDRRVRSEGTIAYLITLDNGFRIMYRDSGGRVTDFEKAAMQRAGRVDLGLIAVSAAYLNSATVEQALEHVRTYKPDVYMPAHHDAPFNNLWRATEPQCIAGRHGLTTIRAIVTVSKACYREARPASTPEQQHQPQPLMSSGEAYDVIVLGSGIAGLSGALAAHELGLKPIVLEKAEKLGGGTNNSYGLIWVGQNHLAQAAGYEDNRDDVIAYMRFLSGGFLDEERMQTFVDRGREALQFFEVCGVRFRVVRGLTDHYYGTAPGTRAVGRSLEVELISGYDLGGWRERVLDPHDVPCFVTAEEQVSWGGINNFSRWDQELVRERKARTRGKLLGLICHLRYAATGVPVPPASRSRTRSRRRGATGVMATSASASRHARAGSSAPGLQRTRRAATRADPRHDRARRKSPASSLATACLRMLRSAVSQHKIVNSLRVMLSTIPRCESQARPACMPGSWSCAAHTPWW
jgi:L-ascorbate metabolism protein UlaG (beta-lactamase superfamily)